MSTITYTATDRTGRTFTRTSGTMAYTHMSLARGSWHCTAAAAAKAGDPVPAVPTAVNGRVKIGDYADHPNAAAVAALIEAKHAAANKPAPVQGARVKKGAPIKGKLGKAEPLSNARAEAEARAEAIANRAAVRQLAERQAESEAAHAAEVERRAAARVAPGGPLGHLCECLSRHTDYTISHGYGCPSAPPPPPPTTGLPPALLF